MNHFIKNYLKRIKFRGKLLLNLETLKKIQKQHLLSIPFENLAIFRNEEINYSKEYLYNKIIKNKRGGICYEVNGLLYYLLKEIGFDVKILSGDVLGDFYDHLFLLVKIEETYYLVDVGFGDSFFEPIQLITDITQIDKKGEFKLISNDSRHYHLLKRGNRLFKNEYTFTLEERSFDDFINRWNYYYTNDDSRFKKHRLCYLERANGRITLTDNKLLITKNNKKRIYLITDEKEYKKVLKKYFKIKK